MRTHNGGEIGAFNHFDFEKKDISFNKMINVGDVVEFRIEEKFPNIKLARNIVKIND